MRFDEMESEFDDCSDAVSKSKILPKTNKKSINRSGIVFSRDQKDF